MMGYCKHDYNNSTQAAYGAAEELRLLGVNGGTNRVFVDTVSQGIGATELLLREWRLILKALNQDISLLETRPLKDEIVAISNLVKSVPVEVLGLDSGLPIYPGPLSVIFINLLGNSIKEAKKRDIADCKFIWGERTVRVCDNNYLCFWTQDRSGGYNPDMIENGVPRFGATTRDSGDGGSGLVLINNMAKMLGTEYIVTGNIEEGGEANGVYFMFFIPINKLNST